MVLAVLLILFWPMNITAQISGIFTVRQVSNGTLSWNSQDIAQSLPPVSGYRIYRRIECDPGNSAKNIVIEGNLEDWAGIK